MNYQALAWAIDCEGSIIIVKRKPTKERRGGYQATVQIAMCDKEFPIAMKEIFKCGTIQVRKRYKDNKKHRDLYFWLVQNQKDTKRILENIEPYLIVKKEKARIVLEFLKYRGTLERSNITGQYEKFPQEVWDRYENYFRQVRELTPIQSRRRHYG